MKHCKRFVCVLIIISFLLTSCSPPPPLISEDETIAPVEPTIPEENSTIEDRIAALEGLTIAEASRITMYTDITPLPHSGEGIGGAGLAWYHVAFGDRFFQGIPTHILNIVENDVAVDTWLMERRWTSNDLQIGDRIMLLAFIEDFNLTAGDLIHALEANFNRPMSEIDALVNWARYGIDPGFSTAGPSERVWERIYSLSDIEAFFSGDVNRLWEIDPGYGVVQNNRAFSPSWIITNVERAVLEEQIPESEVWRIIYMAEEVGPHSESLTRARTFLESGPQGPLEIIGGDINGDGDVRGYKA